MADANPEIGDVATRAIIQAETQIAIGLNIPVFSGVKPYSITAEQWIQRVDNAKATGGWTNCSNDIIQMCNQLKFVYFIINQMLYLPLPFIFNNLVTP
jgi:hypothetical protein